MLNAPVERRCRSSYSRCSSAGRRGGAGEGAHEEEEEEDCDDDDTAEDEEKFRDVAVLAPGLQKRLFGSIRLVLMLFCEEVENRLRRRWTAAHRSERIEDNAREMAVGRVA